jgi:mediator of RNA polymerase II transcription subunit 21
MFASITYIDTRHPASSIPNQVDQHAAANQPSNIQQAPPPPPPPSDLDNRHHPEEPGKFHETLRELAQDLVIKQAQIEALIDSLPGLGNSQEDQEKRIEELEGELREVEKMREEARREREELLGRVETKILGARRL